MDRTGSKLAHNAFDAIAWLDPPFLVGRSVAGKSYAVQIAGRPTTLTLPKKGPGSLAMGEEKPMPNIPDFPSPPLADQIVGGVHISVVSRAGLREKPLIVEALRLRWKDPARTRRVRDDDFVGQGFDQDLAPWLSLVRDWLAAWRGGVRQSVALERTPEIRMASAAYGGSIGGGGEPRAVGLHLERRRISTPAELKGAFAAASAGRSLPLEHQLLAEAVVYASGGQYRHAVISACSAAELALAGSADARLAKAGRSEQEREEILARVSGLVELYRINAVSRRSPIVSIKQVMGELAGPRNRAVHAGEQPNETCAAHAIRTARALVAVRPLPRPLRFLS